MRQPSQHRSSGVPSFRLLIRFLPHASGILLSRLTSESLDRPKSDAHAMRRPRIGDPPPFIDKLSQSPSPFFCVQQEDLLNSEFVGYLVEREYSLVSKDEFEGLFHMKAEASGLELNRMPLHSGRDQLRAGQGSELRGVCRDDLRSCQGTPKVLFGKDGGLTMLELEPWKRP